MDNDMQAAHLRQTEFLPIDAGKTDLGKEKESVTIDGQSLH